MVYVVTANTYEDIYRIEIKLFGVFDNKEQAEQMRENLEIYGYRISVDEVEMNTAMDNGIYLGGYIE